MNVEQVIKCISKMIASGDIPNEVYDKYLSDCPIGFMNEEKLFEYLTKGEIHLTEEDEKALKKEIDKLKFTPSNEYYYYKPQR